MTPLEAIQQQCKALHLSSMAQIVRQALTLAEQQTWSCESFLLSLLEQAVSTRQQRRITRLWHEAQLPTGKTLATFDQNRLPLRVRRQLPWLVQGEGALRVPRQAETILLFGLPGTGKTHLAAAMASNPAKKWRCSLPFWPNAMNGAVS